MSFIQKFFLGQGTRSDSVVTSMEAKSEAGKNKTSIVPGDVLKIVRDGANARVDKVSADTDAIYGVASQGIRGFTVPVIVSGHCIANITAQVVAAASEGKTMGKTCQFGVLVQKVKALKEDGTEIDAYEVKL